ncbi:MAG TPA: BamA/TamA family outer membrane protein [Polyangiaceae bacterium]|nr:BamA/TamA family outer membrane protein [Polyangiaceae bacterium]
MRPLPIPVWALLAPLLLLLLAGCASVEKGRHGIDQMHIQGAKALDEKALAACLITREREHFSLVLGLSEPQCGRPPFDDSPPTLRLWRWPWAEWPSLNQAVLDQDMERVVRWYRARGYYEAKVVRVDFDPPEAATPGAKGECAPEQEECTVSVLVTIDEGQPTLVARVDVSGLEGFEADDRATLADLPPLRVGEPIDEVFYDRGKEALLQAARDRGYAAAEVTGEVRVDTATHSAEVKYELKQGPLCSFGRLTVRGQGRLPSQPIIAAANLEAGKRYDPEVLREIQAEVFALGAFSAVDVRETVKGDRVDVEVEVTPLSNDALRLGVGVLSGNPQRVDTTDQTSIPQWDVHLFARYERRHLFGTLGRFSIDERPRLIFLGPFPTVPNKSDGSPAIQLGNLVTLNLNQPGLLEARTNLLETVGWDLGPDPYLNFLRSDIFMRVAARRGFFSRRLVGTVAVQQDLYVVPQQIWVPPEGVTEPLPVSYNYFYLEEDARVDLRNDKVRPRHGIFTGINATQAVEWKGSDWTSFRLAPEFRFYVPLPFGVVLASRMALGAIFITGANPGLDADSQALGPLVYRLRGGGPNGNRGFLAGGLGPGPSGGVRRWEGSAELRIPLGADFVLAGFVDVGDVNEQTAFRFDYLNMSVGPGLRFYTILGAIRLDTGFRLPSLQRIGDPTYSIASEANPSYLFGSTVAGAFQLTIGDAF